MWSFGMTLALTPHFYAPVLLPVTCPSTTCRYGGSTAADSFHSFSVQSAAAGNILGIANHTTVLSSDSGTTWSILKDLGGWIGPGVAYNPSPSESTLSTVGGMPTNQTGNTTARGLQYATVLASESSAGAWRVTRTMHQADLSWKLPRADVCYMGGYSGSALRMRMADGTSTGVLLKTWVVKTNCSQPPPGQGWGVLPMSSIWLFESMDGLAWSFRSEVVSAAEVVAAVGSEEGANENDVAILSDGRLICVFRVDGGDGWPSHEHKPFMAAYSSDQGRSWTPPTSLSPPLSALSGDPTTAGFVGSARPMLLSFESGPLLLSGGRPHLNLWVSADGLGRSWTPFNLAGEHNKRQPDPALRFCDGFANGTSTWLESTCYTSLQPVLPTRKGAWAALVCYDDLGTEAPAAPSQCQHLKAGVHTFCMKVEEPPSPTPSSGSVPWQRV